MIYRGHHKATGYFTMTSTSQRTPASRSIKQAPIREASTTEATLIERSRGSFGTDLGYYPIEQAAILASRSRATVTKAICAGILPAVKYSRGTYIAFADIEAWFRELPVR
jgi:hypothetical protein